jgi:hypothetical protein
MFEKFKTKLSVNRLLDEELYAQVAEELSDDDIKAGLWAKATANANGVESKVKALYIKYRVQAIQDEDRVLEKQTQQLQAEAESARIKSMEKQDDSQLLNLGEKLSRIDRDRLLKKYGIRFDGIDYYFAGKSFSYVNNAIDFAMKELDK